jgi:hypothetical protein
MVMGGMLLFALLLCWCFCFFCKLFCGGLIPIVTVFNVWNLANVFHCGEKLVILMGFLAVASDGSLEEQLFKKCNAISCGIKHHILICVK